MADSNWIENSKGNFVMLDDDCLRATVFRNSHDAWQIIVNGEDSGRLVADEYFVDAEDATERADAILDGAPCEYARKTTAVVTGWSKQKSTANGEPTYGRKYGKSSVTVKCAVSGKWFYMTYNGPDHSEPFGWFNTPEQAMQTFDSRHMSSTVMDEKLNRLFGQ